jgi:heat shock protein HslJ
MNPPANLPGMKKGDILTLTPSGDGQPTAYFVGENRLTQLDKQGNRITGESAGKYILTKENYAILEKYWKLVELKGNPVTMDSALMKEPHIIFKKSTKRFVGNGGCNSISGTYQVEGPDRIKISHAISTQMACCRMDIEQQFLRDLQAADNFYIVGDALVLNKARMAPLARFKAVLMK